MLGWAQPSKSHASIDAFNLLNGDISSSFAMASTYLQARRALCTVD